MAQPRAYLDYNATAPLVPAARQAVLAALDLPGNASSIHTEGRAARARIEFARQQVAAIAGVPAAQVVFTAGGTEAANLALTPHLATPGNPRPVEWLFIAAGEHPCVLKGHRFPQARTRIVPLTADSVIDLAVLAAMLAETGDSRVMLALQAANNETGVLQPVVEAASLVHASGGVVVCDAVQAAGRIDCSVAALGADLLFFSAHKLGGPKGAGALAWAAAGTHISRVPVRGGGQERGLRAGTENIAAIAGFGAAAEVALGAREAEMERLRRLRDLLEGRLAAMFPEIEIFGGKAHRLANTSCFALADASAETLLIALDLEGLAVSSGSACSSGKVEASHVLSAMGVEATLAKGALRVSLGWDSKQADVERFAEAYGKIVNGMRARRKRAA
ncbi:aminotransferase class V-fold PLP-dependent enzyme [Roseiarcaceae bacterium H3SJ34-1]|uniref:cysteine desulfurase family protein n=1 Tax=Terripilifer ovatus TaxID=3032367 RepID=UPI003AB94E80|nr:aminotransferase class V-fold PLP-dependent enzyme [Roseiarcaceae bacterium H3SJ34-1]